MPDDFDMIWDLQLKDTPIRDDFAYMSIRNWL